MAQPSESPVTSGGRKRNLVVQNNFIREWRKFRGLTQSELGRRAGLTDGAISHVETGISAYTQKMLEAVAPVLGCTPGDLLNINPLHADPIAQMNSLISKLKEFETGGQP